MSFAGAQTQGETYKIDDMDLGIRNKDLLAKRLRKTVVDRKRPKGKMTVNSTLIPALTQPEWFSFIHFSILELGVQGLANQY